jgi:acetyltransferase
VDRAADLNPVLVDEHGATVVDARLVVRPRNPSARPYEHMAIHPYPADLVQSLQLRDGTVLTVRPDPPG